ncbi:MAG: putative manganese transporter [Erysipelotrichaceae bacterium]
MFEILQEVTIDSIKIVPLLFITYLIIEYYEHNQSETNRVKLISWRKFGPIFGALIGCIPQCGFSIVAASLYARKTISAGTLLAVFISTSDEAFPILLSNPSQINTIVKVIGLKILIGVVVGYLVDFVFHEASDNVIESSLEPCGCNQGNVGHIKSALFHTLRIFCFIFLVNFGISILVESIGINQLKNILLNGSILQPFASAFIGLIPNCVASVMIAQLYLIDAIPFAVLVSGLISSAGMGLLMLFKMNKNRYENIAILIILYLVAGISGVILLSF